MTRTNILPGLKETINQAFTKSLNTNSSETTIYINCGTNDRGKNVGICFVFKPKEINSKEYIVDIISKEIEKKFEVVGESFVLKNSDFSVLENLGVEVSIEDI